MSSINFISGWFDGLLEETSKLFLNIELEVFQDLLNLYDIQCQEETTKLEIEINIDNQSLAFKHPNLPFLFEINIDQKCLMIIIRDFHLESIDLHHHIEKHQINLENLDQISLDLETTRKLPSFYSYSKHLKLNSSIVLSVTTPNDFVQPNKFDKSYLNLFNKPNIELLNDWLFCHSHQDSCTIFGEIEEYSIILEKIEQVYHLLDQESEQILFESSKNQNKNIFIKLVQRDIPLFLYQKNLKDNNDEEIEETFIQPEAKNCALVFYKIFDVDNNDVKETQDVIGSKMNDEKILLNNYRMSFEVEWYQINDDLFQTLKSNLQTNLNFFQRFNKFLEQKQLNYKNECNPECSISFLESFQVVEN